MSVVIEHSTELPITSGKIEVDTRKGAVTIFMKPCGAHGKDDELIITKVSKDTNIIYLYSDVTLINGCDIILFGIPAYVKVSRGKVKTLVLKSDGRNWKIVKEE